MSAADTQHQPSAVSSRSTLGIVPATALVMGSVIGTGVFLLPAAFAPYGPISLVGFGLAAVGAVALALTFGALARRDPGAGGPYSYARSTFGALPGFLAAWFYWITAWVSRAGMVVGWIVYVEVFVNTDRNVIGSMVIGMVGLWLPAAINISGLRNMASVQVLAWIAGHVCVRRRHGRQIDLSDTTRHAGGGLAQVARSRDGTRYGQSRVGLVNGSLLCNARGAAGLRSADATLRSGRR